MRATIAAMLELEGKVAVVTGGAGAIGAAIARALYAEGCRVTVVDLASERAGALARELGPRATAFAMDVADPGAWDRLTENVEREHGAANILVNNAGLSVLGAFADQSREDIDRIVDVNLKGVLYGCRAFLPQLSAGGGGHIVNVASLAGRVPFPYQSTYCATKYALVGFSAALRMELAARSIGVTAVLPGAVATRLLETAASYDTAASSKMAALMLAYGLRPERVATRIVRAVRGNEGEVLIGWDAWLTTAAQAMAPSALRAAFTRGFRWRASSRA